MVKILLVLVFIFNFSFANIYEKNCISCHKKLPVSIDKFFYRYLLKYSSKKDVTLAMVTYLQNPNQDKSVLSKALQKRFGLKEKSKLDKKELEEAINIYWEKYKVFGKLK